MTAPPLQPKRVSSAKLASPAQILRPKVAEPFFDPAEALPLPPFRLRVALAAGQMLVYGGNGRFVLSVEAIAEYTAAFRAERGRCVRVPVIHTPEAGRNQHSKRTARLLRGTSVVGFVCSRTVALGKFCPPVPQRCPPHGRPTVVLVSLQSPFAWCRRDFRERTAAPTGYTIFSSLQASCPFILCLLAFCPFASRTDRDLMGFVQVQEAVPEHGATGDAVGATARERTRGRSSRGREEQEAAAEGGEKTGTLNVS